MKKRKSSPATLAALRAHAFKRGDDPNRNKNGPVSKDRVTWAIEFNNLIVKKADPARLIDVLVRKAEAGQPWAMEILIDRILGKPKDNEGQPLVFEIREPKE